MASRLYTLISVSAGAVLHGNSFLDDSMGLEEPMEEPYQVKFKMSRYINKEHIETCKFSWCVLTFFCKFYFYLS